MLGDRDIKATGNSDFEKAIDSWKKAVATLDNAAISSTGISSARSIAIEDIEKLAVLYKDAEYGKKYTFRLGTFLDKQGNVVKATTEKPIIINYTRRYKASKLNLEGSLSVGYYWLANTCVIINGALARYNCQKISDDRLDSWMLFIGNSSSETSDCYNTGVRAIVYI